MTRTARRATAVAFATALLLTAAACGSSSGDKAADKTTTTANADGGKTTTTAGDTGGDDGTTGDDGSTGSGTGTPKLVSEEAPADKTITFTSSDTMSPDTLDVKVGEVFGFKGSDGAGNHSVHFNGASDGFTVSGGLFESFTLDKAGTYEITDELSDAKAVVNVT